MPTAKRQPTEHGTTSTNLMPRHKNVDLCIGGHGRRFNGSAWMGGTHDITDDDMKGAADITDERRVGQRSETLAWFWQMGDAIDVSGPRLQECELSSYSWCEGAHCII